MVRQMERMTITIPKSLYNSISSISEEFQWGKSLTFRQICDNFKFLYEFMNKYMIPNEETPAIQDLETIKKITKVIKWL